MVNHSRNSMKSNIRFESILVVDAVRLINNGIGVNKLFTLQGRSQGIYVVGGEFPREFEAH